MPVSTVLLFILSVLVGIILYTYVFYPVLLSLITGDSQSALLKEEPTVTLVIAAYNEEDIIEEKIENSLRIEYPDEKMNILVFSDASSDRTDDLVRSYTSEGVEFIRIEGRVGKTECQNRVVKQLETDLVVFSDANSLYHPTAIRKLVRRFSGEVACVVGELRYYQSDDIVEGESIYWQYERLIRNLESRVGSVVKGNGAIYAVKRSKYVPLPPDLISDFAEPLAIRSDGCKIKYEPDAVAYERTSTSMADELARKVRIITRSWFALRHYRRLMNPFRYGFYSLQVASRTILWWCSPLLLIAILIIALLLLLVNPSPFPLFVLCGYGILCTLGSIGFVLDASGQRIPTVVHVPYYYLTINYGLLIGLMRFIQGDKIVTWETHDR
ncbi:glycosyltransferase family 2 protein [Halomontanus rarus]|uniref:glycosyltransferase family 2 protein n=1 Tax=Halomontanus rarus TaxID=3034020 RepID=UPI0023E83CEF|nr:glycosyltransferase family 2 protein [Halovivax sp. TS33]